MRSTFSRDGSMLAAASTDKSARVWEVTTGLPLSLPLRRAGPVESVEFSPDGLTLLTSRCGWIDHSGVATGEKEALIAPVTSIPTDNFPKGSFFSTWTRPETGVDTPTRRAPTSVDTEMGPRPGDP